MAIAMRADIIARRGDGEWLARTPGGSPWFGRLVDVTKGIEWDGLFVPGILAEDGWEQVGSDDVTETEWTAATKDVVTVPPPPEVATALATLARAWDEALAATQAVKHYRVLSEAQDLFIIGADEALAALQIEGNEQDEVLELEMDEETFWRNQDWLREVRRLREQGVNLADLPDNATDEDIKKAVADAKRRNPPPTASAQPPVYGDEIVLTEEDEAILDRIWDRRGQEEAAAAAGTAMSDDCP